MKIPNSINKLEDARTSLDNLKKSNNSLEYRAAFSSFLNCIRAITYALQKECNKEISFKKWYEKKQMEMKNDDLLRFFHDARTEDFHEGTHRLIFVSNANAINLDLNLVMSRSPELFSKGDSWEITLTGEGLSTTINIGTPEEKRVMLDQTLLNSTKISLINPPNSHLGKDIGSNDPIVLCNHIMTYMENLIFEVKRL